MTHLFGKVRIDELEILRPPIALSGDVLRDKDSHSRWCTPDGEPMPSMSGIESRETMLAYGRYKSDPVNHLQRSRRLAWQDRPTRLARV